MRSPETSDGVVPMPTEVGAGVWLAPDASDDATSLAKLIGHMSLHSGGEASMQGCLDRSFKRLNSSVLERDCPPHLPCAPPPHFCHDAGMCLCTRDGQELARMRLSMHAILTKPAAKPHSDGRADLKDGKWLLRFVGRYERRAVEGSDAPAFPEEQMEFLFHDCYHCLSPWKATWHLVTEASAPPGEPAADDRRIYTQVVG